MNAEKTAAVVDGALAQWGLAGHRATLIAARENHVYRVDSPNGTRAALRLHRLGYRTDAELASELDWMAVLAEGGLSVPTPLLSQEGVRLHRVEGQQVSLLSWLDAEPMGATGQPLQHADRTGLFATMGQTLARLHDLSDQWTPPEGFTRQHWTAEGLVGEAPLWDRFWDNPTLSAEDARTFQRFRSRARETLSGDALLDVGLIHADMVRENVLIDQARRLSLIDFDDGGYGYRLFDVATALIKNTTEPDYPDLQAALLDGYQSARRLDTTQLDFFMALRAATYVGWIITRLAEPGGSTRNARMVLQARTLIEAL